MTRFADKERGAQNGFREENSTCVCRYRRVTVFDRLQLACWLVHGWRMGT